jgi:hypothetical protein
MPSVGQDMPSDELPVGITPSNKLILRPRRRPPPIPTQRKPFRCLTDLINQIGLWHRSDGRLQIDHTNGRVSHIEHAISQMNSVERLGFFNRLTDTRQKISDEFWNTSPWMAQGFNQDPTNYFQIVIHNIPYISDLFDDMFLMSNPRIHISERSRIIYILDCIINEIIFLYPNLRGGKYKIHKKQTYKNTKRKRKRKKKNTKYKYKYI